MMDDNGGSSKNNNYPGSSNETRKDRFGAAKQCLKIVQGCIKGSFSSELTDQG